MFRQRLFPTPDTPTTTLPPRRPRPVTLGKQRGTVPFAVKICSLSSSAQKTAQTMSWKPPGLHTHLCLYSMNRPRNSLGALPSFVLCWRGWEYLHGETTPPPQPPSPSPSPTQAKSLQPTRCRPFSSSPTPRAREHGQGSMQECPVLPRTEKAVSRNRGEGWWWWW